MRRPGGPIEIGIERLGFKGDGIAEHAGRPLIVPLALPGERWRVRLAARGDIAEPIACVIPAADRAAPVCPHFGRCGGCALQHLPDATYVELKLRRIEGALRARAIEPPADMGLARSPLHSRRRLRLAFDRRGGLGFRRRGSREVVAIGTCPIARPELEALLDPLRRLAAALGCRGPGGEASLTLLDDGVDLLLHLAAPPDLVDRERLAAFATAERLVRLCVAVDGGPPEPIAVLRPPIFDLGGIAVEPPAGAFLQATREGEAAMQGFVAERLPGVPRIVDLFAGLGTLGLPLVATDARVHAVDAVPELLAACRHSRRTTEVRDLFASPLGPAELRRFDAAILDPPRAGASAQARALAASAVPQVIYASCEPASFARDAHTLIDAGYALEALLAIDQFVYSAEVELIAWLRRPAAVPA